MGLAEMRARRAAAQAQPQVDPAPSGTSARGSEPTEEPKAPDPDASPQRVGLDFNDGEAVPKYDEKTPRIPWNIVLQSRLELKSLVHVNARSCTFYKAEVLVCQSNHEEIRVGQTWSLLYYYEPQPRKQEEEWGNNATKREMRKLAAALAGQDVKDPTFDANRLLGDLQKDTVVANGESLGIPFDYEQYTYYNKKGELKYGAKYGFVD